MATTQKYIKHAHHVVVGGGKNLVCHWPFPALEFNRPLIAISSRRHPGKLPPEKAFITLSPPNLVLSCWKRSFFRDGLIVRWYEIEGKPTSGTLSVSFPISKAYETNLLEEDLQEVNTHAGSLRLKTGRFEIKTVKLKVEKKI